MKPLIKWPGGKSSEIRQFLPLIPDYERYIEPFAGGAALCFYLNPEKALLNDTSEYLMDFYRLIKEQDSGFKSLLDEQCRSFSALKTACDREYTQIRALFELYEYAVKKGMNLSKLRLHEPLVKDIVLREEVRGSLISDEQEYLEILAASVKDKLERTVRLQMKKPLSEKDLRGNLVTGFTSGYYLYFRKIFNDIAAGRIIASRAWRSANFYFIREYCYGSMFRYNRDGDFNIPYGGISYNRKDMAAKIAHMFSPDVASLLSRTGLYCKDFEEFLEEVSPTEQDFLFLDPPYDTEFSDYEGKSFGKDDQYRLAEYLKGTKARFLLVIKNTEYIYRLYDGAFRILAFENRYMYNMRSRNERKSEHLIITNLPEGEVPWLRENVTV